MLRAPGLGAADAADADADAEPQRMLYAGWPQFTSFIPEYNVGCGWSGDPAGALAATRVTKLCGSPR